MYSIIYTVSLTALNTVTGEAPWAVCEIEAYAGINLDAERKITQLNEELQSLVGANGARDPRVSLQNWSCLDEALDIDIYS